MRRRTAALAVAVGLLAGGPGTAWADDDPLHDAREAAAQLQFNAVVTVRWVDAVGAHEATVQVRGDRGRIVIDGPREVVAGVEGTMVLHANGWAQLWASGPTALDPPPAGAKYDLRTGPGEPIAGRPTTSVEVWAGDELRERLAVDDSTGLVLYREQLDRAGRPVRVVSVEQLDVANVAPPSRPEPEVRYDARPVQSSALPRLFRAPDRLAAGYVQVAAYRRGNLVHLLYSDGLHGLSVFAQPGRLDTGSLPGGGRQVRLGNRVVWAYEWPGGEALMWEEGPLVYTVVGDGDSDELRAAVASLPPPPSLSVVGRLRQSARAMAQVLAG